MKPELEQQLINTAPSFFVPGKGVCFDGFNMGDGWFQPLLKMAEKIEKYLQSLPESERAIVCDQCKQKLGGLRVYASRSDVQIDAIIAEAEKECANTCEDCGISPAKLGYAKPRSHYVQTLCDAHRVSARAGRQRPR